MKGRERSRSERKIKRAFHKSQIIHKNFRMYEHIKWWGEMKNLNLTDGERRLSAKKFSRTSRLDPRVSSIADVTFALMVFDITTCKSLLKWASSNRNLIESTKTKRTSWAWKLLQNYPNKEWTERKINKLHEEIEITCITMMFICIPMIKAENERNHVKCETCWLTCTVFRSSYSGCASERLSLDLCWLRRLLTHAPSPISSDRCRAVSSVMNWLTCQASGEYSSKWIYAVVDSHLEIWFGTFSLPSWGRSRKMSKILKEILIESFQVSREIWGSSKQQTPQKFINLYGNYLRKKSGIWCYGCGRFLLRRPSEAKKSFLLGRLNGIC